MSSNRIGRSRTKRSQSTKDAILEAAARVLAEVGYESASLERVAEGAGLTKGTLYYHFDSKEAIYAAVLQRYLSDAHDRLQADASHERSAADSLVEVIDGQLDDTLSPITRYVHYQEIVRVDDETHELIRRAQRRYESAMADLIRRGQAEGDIMDGDPMVIAFLLIGAMGRTSRWFRASGRVSEAELRRTVKRLLLGGLVSGDARSRLGVDGPRGGVINRADEQSGR